MFNLEFLFCFFLTYCLNFNNLFEVFLCFRSWFHLRYCILPAVFFLFRLLSFVISCIKLIFYLVSTLFPCMIFFFLNTNSVGRNPVSTSTVAVGV